MKLPKEDIEGIKLSAMGGSSKRDYLTFDCAIKDKGAVRYKYKNIKDTFLFKQVSILDFTQVDTVLCKKNVTNMTFKLFITF